MSGGQRNPRVPSSLTASLQSLLGSPFSPGAQAPPVLLISSFPTLENLRHLEKKEKSVPGNWPSLLLHIWH